MEEQVIRVYTKKLVKENTKRTITNSPTKYSRVLVFDTETTADEYQNMLFGFFTVYENNIYQYKGLIYDPRHITSEDLETLEKYAEDYFLRLISLEIFIEIFYHEIYDLETLCVGFNINFDLSRIALSYHPARYKHNGGFSILLTTDTSKPRIRIKHLNGRNFSINFTRAKRYIGTNTFQGNFLDVQKLACVLSGKKSLSLETACQIFDTPIKKHAVKQHGIITPDYITYNINDVLSTYELYQILDAELKRYGLSIDSTKISSEASIGKQILLEMGINNNRESLTDQFIGYAMSAYFGGRCECKIRKMPIKITVLDFTSMYPTTIMLLGLWEYIIADRICMIETTEETQTIIDNFSLNKGFDKTLWKNFNTLVELENPENLRLPLRSQYDINEHTYNIGINNISKKGKIYYFLPDILAAKLFTKQQIIIKKAYSFKPEKKQDSLKRITLYGEEFNPLKQNLMQFLVEKRREFKAKTKSPELPLQERLNLDRKQLGFKTMTNATGYGIYMKYIHKKQRKQ